MNLANTFFNIRLLFLFTNEYNEYNKYKTCFPQHVHGNMLGQTMIFWHFIISWSRYFYTIHPIAFYLYIPTRLITGTLALVWASSCFFFHFFIILVYECWWMTSARHPTQWSVVVVNRSAHSHEAVEYGRMRAMNTIVSVYCNLLSY